MRVRGGKVYSIFSATSSESPNCCVGMLAASATADLTQAGARTEAPGCVFSRDEAAGVCGPGAMIWLKSPDQSSDWVICHVRTVTASDMSGADQRLEATKVSRNADEAPNFGALVRWAMGRRRIKTMAREHPRWGCRRVHATLRRKGVQVNRKTVHRLWKSEALALPIRRKTRTIRTGQAVPLRAEQPKQVWTYAFVFDQTRSGPRLNIPTLTDEFTRQSLARRCATAFTSVDVNAVLVGVMRERGVPAFIRSDNGPECIAHDLKAWLAVQEVGTRYIDPGRPWQHGVAESLRDAWLNLEVFHSARHAQVLLDGWRTFYNSAGPHSSLAYLIPDEFAHRWAQSTAPPVVVHSP